MYILFDIGGTKMRIAGSRDGATFDTPVVLATPAGDFEEGVRLFVKTAQEIAGGEAIENSIGGIAGVLDAGKTMLAKAPHLPGWAQRPLKERLEGELHAPVFIENDASLAALGEVAVGAGKGYDLVAYITVGTGVGGARIIRGAIDENRFGFEPGHQIIHFDESARQEWCGETGDLEGYISGTAFAKRYGKKSYEVADPDAWEEAARILAVGLNNVAVLWSPEVIVLGGSMLVGVPAIPLERVQHHLRNVLQIFPKPPEVLQAKLGDTGGLHGALAFLKTSLGRTSSDR